VIRAGGLMRIVCIGGIVVARVHIVGMYVMMPIEGISVVAKAQINVKDKNL
jgi:hypothetical protein